MKTHAELDAERARNAGGSPAGDAYTPLEHKAADMQTKTLMQARERAEIKSLEARTALNNCLVIFTAWVVFWMMAAVAVYGVRLAQAIKDAPAVPIPPFLGG